MQDTINIPGEDRYLRNESGEKHSETAEHGSEEGGGNGGLNPNVFRAEGFLSSN